MRPYVNVVKKLIDLYIIDIVGFIFKHERYNYIVKQAVHNRNGYWTLICVKRRNSKQNLFVDVLVDDGKIIYVDL
jgi:hypothetical protein